MKELFFSRPFYFVIAVLLGLSVSLQSSSAPENLHKEEKPLKNVLVHAGLMYGYDYGMLQAMPIP